jgi:PrtD family type I secretion system ABC transporter
LVFGLLEAFRGRILTRLGFALEGSLREPALGAWMESARKVGVARHPPVADLQTIRSFLQGPGPSAICDAPWAPLFLLVLFMLHPLIGLVGTIAVVVLLVLAAINEFASRKTLNDARKGRAGASEFSYSAASNADAVVAMGLLPRISAKYQAISDQAIETELPALDRTSLIVGLTKAARIAAQVLILGCGAWLVLGNELTAGGMIAASIILGRTLAPAEQAIGAWRTYIPAREAWERLQSGIGSVESAGPMMQDLPAPKGQIDVENLLVMGAPDAPPILVAINFSLSPGETCAILGPSGAGKSTLCRVMVGAHPANRGVVKIDGVDTRLWAPAERGRYIGYVSQEAGVIAGTIEENISRFEDRDPDALIAAMQAAGIYEMVMNLPAGLNTLVGPGGLRLSGGQRQRLAMACAIYTKPKVLILDEPNSNLDQSGEKLLLNIIQSLKAEGATILMVVHRPSLLQAADKFLFLRNGHQENFADRDALLAKGVDSNRVVPMPVATPRKLTPTSKTG